jgi:hypothetical protein
MTSLDWNSPHSFADLSCRLKDSRCEWQEQIHEDNGLAEATHLILSPLTVPGTHRVELLFAEVFLCVLGQ